MKKSAGTNVVPEPKITITPTGVDISAVSNTMVPLKPLGTRLEFAKRFCSAELAGSPNNYQMVILSEELRNRAGEFTCEFVFTMVRYEGGIQMCLLEMTRFVNGGVKGMALDANNKLFIKTGMSKYEIVNIQSLEEVGYVRQDDIPYDDSRHTDKLRFLCRDAAVEVTAPDIRKPYMVPIRHPGDQLKPRENFVVA